MNDTEIDLTLAAVASLIKTLDLGKPPEQRVWVHPGESLAIETADKPFVIISKLNTEPGSWGVDSFGAGQHNWDLLIAVYLEDGPIQVTNSDDITISAMAYAHDWYKALSDLLFANLTLLGTADMIGDGQGKLYDYITDNIMWDGKHYYGHLFIVPIVHKIIQTMEA